MRVKSQMASKLHDGDFPLPPNMQQIAATTLVVLPRAVMREDPHQKTLEQLKTAVITDLPHEENLTEEGNVECGYKLRETQKGTALRFAPMHLTLLRRRDTDIPIRWHSFVQGAFDIRPGALFTLW